MEGLTTPAYTPGYSILLPFSHYPDPDRETQVKSHLAWIYAHSRMHVKYKVVPKGYGISCVKVEEACKQHFLGRKNYLGANNALASCGT